MDILGARVYGIAFFSSVVSSIPSGYPDLQIVFQGPGLRAVAIDSKTN
jgi:hypothetical protein